MPDIKILEYLFIYLGIPVGTILILILIICLALWAYPRFKVFIGDLLKLFGKTSKWVRRKSLETEFEGSINMFTRQFNSELSITLLPECTIEWVTPENVKSYITPGKAILRLSFGEDHELNFYNTASAFIDISLLPRAKPFLNKMASRAIDLLMIKTLLTRSRRQVLNIFNNKFRDEEREVKERFFQCEETDRRGLFKRILLQEYHFWGEAMGEKTPNESHHLESERFWEWFYELATRESEEMTDLSFRSQHFNIGVILVADPETYERFGKSPYIRRAYTYASNECQSIYIISRGPVKGKIAKEIARDLIDTGCFECLTKDSDIRIQEGINKSLLLVTCIALKPSLLAIVEKAWEELSIAKQKGSPIVVSVREVSKSGVSIEVFGLRVGIDNENLSSLKIDDARKYFQINDELVVNTVECHEESQKVLLSNMDTDTDPKRLVDEFKDYKETPIDARIERMIVYSDARDIGFIVGFPGKQLKGYVPRQFATYSRFEELSKRYQPAQEIRVLIKNFNAGFKTFVCSIYGLEDPWLSLAKYEVGNQAEGVVRQISQHYILCELVPGLEARIPLDEVSWGKEDIKKEILRGYKLGDIVHGKIIDINLAKKRLIFSIKRTTENPIELFFTKHAHQNIEGRVTEVNQVFAKLSLGSEGIEGYLSVSELMWNYCGDLRESLKVGQQLNVNILSYDPSFENIKVSHKRTYSNNFQEFLKHFKVGDYVTGRLKCVNDNRAIVSISFGDKMQVEGYVHKSEISNICFIDEITIRNVFMPDKEYRFIVKRMDEHFQVIELSRKRYLKAEIGKIKYGNVYNVIMIREINGRNYAHGEVVEGFLIDRKGRSVKNGDGVDVVPAKIDINSGYVELNPVSKEKNG